MADLQLSVPGQIVKKDNLLIRTRINIASVDAGRILANLISCIQVDDKKIEATYSVAVKDFLTDSSGRGYARIKALCHELAGATAEMEEPDPDGPHPIFHARPFFTDIKYKRGIVSAIFNPLMAPYLFQLKACFTQYNLIEYLQLPSFYSQRLFEILKSWRNIPEVILTMEQLHRMLNSPASFRADFRQFRRFVLEKAYKDITEKTAFRYEWEPIKVGKSVEKIRFTFGTHKLALSSIEKDKAKSEKQIRLQNARFKRAIECFQSKGGKCHTQTEKNIVCKLCKEIGICYGK